MTRFTSPRIGGYASLAALGLLAGLASGRVELVAIAAPFALAALTGAVLARDPSCRGGVALTRERALEGETVAATIRLSASVAVDRLELFLPVPAELAAAGANPRALRLSGGEERTLELPLRCERWGAFRLGPVLLRAHDVLGFHAWEGAAGEPQPLRVYPRAETVRDLLAPLETQVFVGNQVARARGDGIEFADVRPWAPGDRVRRINWRASARRGDLWVNEQHPERNADVVLFLDTFAEVRVRGRGTHDLAVRAATSLAHGYLQRRDRVGLVGFGGVLTWLVPASGAVQLYRIVDSLLQTDVVQSFATRDVAILPRRSLPPQALVVALTPLLDERSAGALLDLRARGFDLVVIEVSPVEFVRPARDELSQLSYRLWKLSREALRARYRQAGVPVVSWREGLPLDVAIEEVTRYRRFARVAHA